MSPTERNPHELAAGVFGWLESPRADDAITDCVFVTGWAFSRSARISAVHLKVAGRSIPLRQGTEREDVAAAYPADASARSSGFSGFVEWPADTRPKAIEIWATLADGREVRLFRRRRAQGFRGRSSSARLVAQAAAHIVSHPGALLSREAWSSGIRLLRQPGGPPPPPAADVNQELVRASCVALEAFLTSGMPFQLPRASLPLVSVVIVVWNKAELTFRCLRALCAQPEVPLEIVVVNNHSTDATDALLRRTIGLTVVTNEENEGFTVAANQGARVARGELVLFLNNDAEPLPGSLKPLVDTLSMSPKIGAVGGTLIFPDGRLQEAGSIVWSDGSCEAYGRGGEPGSPEYNFRRAVDFVSGAFLMTRRDLFSDCGGFDERYKPAYYEDADYCVKLWQRGLRVLFEPQAAAVHHEFGSATTKASSIGLQVERRAIFEELHRGWLAGQHARSAGALVARVHPGQRTVLVIDDMVPDPRLGAGFPRALELIRALQALDVQVTLFTTADMSAGSLAARLPGVEVISGPGVPGLGGFLTERHGTFDMFIVSRAHNLRYLKAAIGSDLGAATAPVIYDAEGIGATREIGRRRLAGESMSDQEAAALLREEVDLARGCAAVLAVNAIDQGLFAEAGVEVSVLGHAVAPDPTPASFLDREGLLFVGGFGPSSPSEDAATYLVTELIPLLNGTLGVTVPVAVAGARLPLSLQRLVTPGVQFQPDVDDLTRLYNKARVFVAPTRFAAGIPLKVIEAAARGVPVVCSKLLARQLGWEAGRELLAADSPEEYADQIALAYQDPETWSRLRANGLRRVEADYGVDRFRSELAAVLEPLMPAARSL